MKPCNSDTLTRTNRLMMDDTWMFDSTSDQDLSPGKEKSRINVAVSKYLLDSFLGRIILCPYHTLILYVMRL